MKALSPDKTDLGLADGVNGPSGNGSLGAWGHIFIYQLRLGKVVMDGNMIPWHEVKEKD